MIDLEDRVAVHRLLSLLALDSRQMNRVQLTQARIQAGLSLGQAARLLDVTPHELAMIELISHIEHYWAARREMIANRMNAVYRVGRAA